MHNKSLTLRLPNDIYERLVGYKRKSISSYILEAVKEKIERDTEVELAAGFANLRGEPDEDLPLWLEAQREAMRHVGD